MKRAVKKDVILKSDAAKVKMRKALAGMDPEAVARMLKELEG